MGMLPKGFGNSVKENLECDYNGIPIGCTMIICPTTCKRLFYSDENHKECNFCIVGRCGLNMVSNIVLN